MRVRAAAAAAAAAAARTGPRGGNKLAGAGGSKELLQADEQQQQQQQQEEEGREVEAKGRSMPAAGNRGRGRPAWQQQKQAMDGVGGGEQPEEDGTQGRGACGGHKRATSRM
ncbi:hypothetical protein COO60DRAFT_1638458 [Scenedesmus sp. NREL 46B-D3]|nr:hypothetical protein COO60DRAFT_1638458 [Scenedesmus sp. NREL 46B-D3]